MKKSRAFLKWAGGKYSLIDDIRRYLPEGELLIEPFVGAGSVFLNTNYDKYLLGDVNSDLITLFNHVKRRTDCFAKEAKVLFSAENNTASAYYRLREEFNKSTDSFRRSVLFLYLNRHGYNGLCRYNKQGQFNVPFGQYTKPYFPEVEIYIFAEKAKKATFICTSYDKIMLKAKTGSVIYCDPPYVPLSLTASFTAYHTNDFDLNEQIRLAKLAIQVSNIHNVPVLISNHDTKLTREWYKSAELYTVKARRSISSAALGRVSIHELLALFT